MNVSTGYYRDRDTGLRNSTLLYHKNKKYGIVPIGEHSVSVVQVALPLEGIMVPIS